MVSWTRWSEGTGHSLPRRLGVKGVARSPCGAVRSHLLRDACWLLTDVVQPDAAAFAPTPSSVRSLCRQIQRWTLELVASAAGRAPGRGHAPAGGEDVADRGALRQLLGA